MILSCCHGGKEGVFEMKKKSLIALLLLVSICLAVITPGCAADQSKEEITITVTEYLESIKSGNFVNENFRSALVRDDPFSTLHFKDENVRECMKASFPLIAYEIKEVSGNRKEKIGECIVSLSCVDVSSVMNSFDKEWVTVSGLMEKLTAADAPTVSRDVMLIMEYDETVKKWLISASSDVAIALGLPYAGINLYTEAGSPKDVFDAFIQDLHVGKFSDLGKYFPNDSFVDKLFQEDTDMAVRKRFLWGIKSFVRTEELGDGKCVLDVKFSGFDMKKIQDILVDNVDIQCEMMKYILTGVLDDPQNASLDEFRKIQSEQMLEKMEMDRWKNHPVYQADENNRVEMEISEDGKRWVILDVPEALIEKEYEQPKASAEIMRAATGMAVIELCDEGIITSKERDLYLKQFQLTKLKYSSRQVRDSLVWAETYNCDTYDNTDAFLADETERIGIYCEFDKPWPGLVVYVMVYKPGNDDPIGMYTLTTGKDADYFAANLLYSDNEVWPSGYYVVRIYGVDMTQIRQDMEFRVSSSGLHPWE